MARNNAAVPSIGIRQAKCEVVDSAYPNFGRQGYSMPNYIDAPNKTPGRFGRRTFLVVAALVVAGFIGVRIALSAWVDLLWFQSLGFGAIFTRTVLFEGVAFVAFTVITFLILFGAFTVIRRSNEADLPTGQSILVGGQPVRIAVGPILRILSIVVAAILGLLTGLAMVSEWPTLALFWYAPHASGSVVDPIFGKPLNFFLFTLPAWELINHWLLTIAFACVFVAVLFLVLTSTTRALNKQSLRYGPSPFRGLSTAAAFFLAILAVNVFASRYTMLLDHQTVFDGVTYTDAHISIPGLLIVAIALLVGAGLAAANALRQASARRIGVAVVPAAVAWIGLTLVSWYTASFIVKPNELVREQPFITHNITLTRQAYGLDGFTQQEFPAETSAAAADPQGNQPTLQNIRLWDWHALQDTLRQVQEIRTYYDFPDIDIDRYSINGTLREVMLAARELNVEKLPESSRNWINERLIYTHGYGVTMNPVNGFTPEGLPNFFLSNMPVQSAVPSIQVNRPEVYFGELTDTDVYVKTRQQEFDYPQGQSNNVTSYTGTGGIGVGGFFRRLVIAFDRGDLGKLPFSDDVSSSSRLLMHRSIRDRVARIAPFLTFDGDPYIVVGADGRLSWIMDAYTTSDSYPESTHANLGDQEINYLRNSVKVVVDAYNGTVTFYDFDSTDPILQTYERVFPALFRPASEMPADLRQHIRYPEDLLKTQSQLYGLYHMTNAEVFFNREDLWTVATESVSDQDGQQSVEPMKPNFVLMKLPGGTSEEFVEILPFTPANRNNLIGWIAARSDGKNYGTAVVYDFPKTRVVDGPQQIEARIDQNAQLSGQLTLWNQQGSHVLRGSLLVIPTGKALLYAEPIYLQAQQSPMPELRLVVLALQDRLAYGPTFQAALSSLFGNETSSLSASASDASAPAEPMSAAPVGQIVKPTAVIDTQTLIARASQDFADYQRLTAAGKLAEAGQKLDALKQTLDQLSQQKK
jgi:uncharacterized membrane protein (UPF0182 family)